MPSKYKSYESIVSSFKDFKKFATIWILESIFCGTIKGANFLIDNGSLEENKDNIGNFFIKSINPFGISILISISFDK